MNRPAVTLLLAAAAALSSFGAHAFAEGPPVPAVSKELPPRPVAGTLLPKTYNKWAPPPVVKGK